MRDKKKKETKIRRCVECGCVLDDKKEKGNICRGCFIFLNWGVSNV